jgi:hypothetical protein
MFKAGFDQATFATALKKECDMQKGKSAEILENMANYTAFYSAGGVLQWAMLLNTPTPGVQINMETIDRIAQANFAHGPPDRIMHNITINVTEDRFRFGACIYARWIIRCKPWETHIIKNYGS